jgi:hemolysin III
MSVCETDKPRLRGWFHVAAALGCLPAGWALLHVAQPGKATLAAAVYMVSIFLLFGISGIYHRIKWSESGLARMRRVDHGMIFVSMGGFFTPFGLLALPPEHGQWLMLAIWGGAAAGVLRVLLWPYAPRWASVTSYAAVACLGIPFLGEVESHLSSFGVTCVTLGFTAAGVGGICYAIGKPEVWPGWLGHHEVFHLTVIVCAACYYLATWTLVAG